MPLRLKVELQFSGLSAQRPVSQRVAPLAEQKEVARPSGVKVNVQSSRLSVQLPVGQSVAPRAEHLPSQLLPLPQVTCKRVLLAEQHDAFVMFCPKLNALSNKFTDFELFSPTVQINGGSPSSVRPLSDRCAFSM